MRTLTFRLIALLLLTLSANVYAGGSHMASFTSKQDFNSVKSNITDAIAGKGLVINTTSHIGEMLERTGKDLGGAKQIFLNAEALEFCSATVSRQTMEADPHNIVFCPYIIYIYVLPQEPNKTYVSYRKPQPVGTPASKKSLKEVEKLLRSIIEESL